MSKTYSVKTVLTSQRRVLKMLDDYLAAQNQTKLWASVGGGLMCPGELREHIQAALALKVKR